MNARRWLLAVVVVVALFLLVGRAVSELYVDYRWFAAMRATEIWRARVLILALLRGVSGLVGTLFVFFNLYVVRQSVVSLVLPRRVANLDIPEEVPGRYLMTIVLGLSLLFGGLLAIPLDDWTSLGLVLYGAPFGETDPYFQSDLQFFVYWLPFEQSLHVWATLALVLVTLVVVFFYALTPSLRWERGRLRVSIWVRRHLFVLGAILLVLLAWSYRLDAFRLLSDGSGPNGAFTAVDHDVGIPANIVLGLVTLSAAVLVLWAGWTGQIRIAFGAVTAVLVLSLMLRQLVPITVSRLISPLRSDVRERPYIATRLGYTRRAYGVDEVARDDSADLIPSAAAALRAVSAWDSAALARAVTRAFQGHAVGGVGFRSDNGRLTAIVVQRPSGLEAGDPLLPWTVVQVDPSAVGERGSLVIADSAGGITSRRSVVPALVYEGASGPLLVSDSAGRVAAPDVESFGSRLGHAWSEQNLRLLFGDLPEPTPRLVRVRDVRERVGMLVPFFQQGTSVTPILRGDSVYWAIDLYSASAYYPLSERATFGDDEVRYLHHAATAIVQAYTGVVRVVTDSVLDPMAAGWVARFPRFFTRRGDVPADLLSAVPPPVDGALVQAAAYAHAGSRGEATDGAHLPRSFGADTALAESGPTPFVAPSEPAATAVAIPILDASEHIRGAVVARGGGAPRTGYVPFASADVAWTRALESLQHASDSASGSGREGRLTRGRVRLLPLRAGPALVQTSYTWRLDGPPTIAQVTTLVDDTLRSRPTLAETLSAQPPETPSPRMPTGGDAFRARVATLYAEMRDALRAGDWARFGRAYEALGLLLRSPPH